MPDQGGRAGHGLHVSRSRPSTARCTSGTCPGPYLAADIAARAARARGERVVVTTGLDVHQNYVLTRAENEGVDVGRDDGRLPRRHQGDATTWPGSATTGSSIRSSDEHAPIIRQLMNHLVASGAAPMREVTLHACADCDRTLHESYLVGLCGECKAPAAGGACEVCGGFTSRRAPWSTRSAAAAAASPVRSRRPSRYCGWRITATALTAMWLRAELPPAVRALIEPATWRDGLPEIPLAYPTNWGIEGDGPLDRAADRPVHRGRADRPLRRRPSGRPERRGPDGYRGRARPGRRTLALPRHRQRVLVRALTGRRSGPRPESPGCRFPG